MGEHRDYVKREVLTEPAGEHFNSRGHNVSHLKGQAIEQIRSRDPYVLRAGNLCQFKSLIYLKMA